MNSTDLCLQRLLRSARRVRTPLPGEAPFHVETQILHAWREGLAPENIPLPLPILRGAFICACAILIISTVLTLRSLKEGTPDEVMILDNAIQLTLLQ
jgi:hypothetical protein